MVYRMRVISTREDYSFWGFLEAILFSKIKEVTKGEGTIQERVLITLARYVFLMDVLSLLHILAISAVLGFGYSR